VQLASTVCSKHSADYWRGRGVSEEYRLPTTSLRCVVSAARTNALATVSIPPATVRDTDRLESGSRRPVPTSRLASAAGRVDKSPANSEARLRRRLARALRMPLNLHSLLLTTHYRVEIAAGPAPGAGLSWLILYRKCHRLTLIPELSLIAHSLVFQCFDGRF